jgi:bacterioferritin-associated ferredoxin
MYVCLCKGLTESDVRQVLLSQQTGRVDSERLTKTLGLDDEDCCGRCMKNIKRLTSLPVECQGCSGPSLAQAAQI